MFLSDLAIDSTNDRLKVASLASLYPEQTKLASNRLHPSGFGHQVFDTFCHCLSKQAGNTLPSLSQTWASDAEIGPDTISGNRYSPLKWIISLIWSGVICLLLNFTTTASSVRTVVLSTLALS